MRDLAVLEATACNEAMNVAQDAYIFNVCVASDCLEVVKNPAAPAI
jgi:hypothetical protein